LEEAKTRFEEYDLDKDDIINLNDFIGFYLQDEEYCRQKIQSTRKVINEARQERASFENKLREAKVRLRSIIGNRTNE